MLPDAKQSMLQQELLPKLPLLIGGGRLRLLLGGAPTLSLLRLPEADACLSTGEGLRKGPS